MISGETDINGVKGNGQTNEDRHTEQWTGQTDRQTFGECSDNIKVRS